MIASSLIAMPNAFAQNAQTPSGLSPNTLAAASYFSGVCASLFNQGVTNRRTIQAATSTVGISAQFHNDVSAFLDYQQLLGFESVLLKSIVAGVRLQF